MFLTLKIRLYNIFSYLKLAWYLTDDPILNILISLHYQITKIKNEVHLSKNIDYWAEKLQDINLVLTLLEAQINDDYFSNLSLNIDKYQNQFTEIKNKLVQIQEYRTEEEIYQDEEMLINAGQQKIEDYKKIFKILGTGLHYIDGMQSWLDENNN